MSREALSAGQAIRLMLAGDCVEGSQEQLSLFRDPGAGEEITYERSRSKLRRALHLAGLPTLATGTHSLRTGGATAYAHTKLDVFRVYGFVAPGGAARLSTRVCAAARGCCCGYRKGERDRVCGAAGCSICFCKR